MRSKSRIIRHLGLIFGAIVIIGLVIVVSNILKGIFSEDQKVRASTKIKMVVVDKVSLQSTDGYITINGTVKAKERIDVFAEVSGKMLSTSKRFKEGVKFNKGEVLISIDNKEAKLNLQSQKSSFLTQLSGFLADVKIEFPEEFAKWEKFSKEFKIDSRLPAFPKSTTDKEKIFVASRNIMTSFFALQSAEEKLDKFTISAPFDGVVAASMVDPGTLIRGGQKLGEFSNTNVFELEASISVTDAAKAKVGTLVSMHSSDVNKTISGRISRISSKLNNNNQTVSLFIDISDKDLIEGMFLTGKFGSSSFSDAYLVNRSLIDNDEIFLVKDSLLQSQKIEILKIEGENAIISGVKEGDLVVTIPFAGAYNGLKVKPVIGE